jgi:hypothetical protein
VKDNALDPPEILDSLKSCWDIIKSMMSPGIKRITQKTIRVAKNMVGISASSRLIK